jgi:membrane fusion protein, multidrug efflux system
MSFPKRLRYAAAAGPVLAALLASGCKSKPAIPPAAMPVVGVVTLQPERLVMTTELPGRTSAYLTAEIRPQVNGLIQKRHFQEGAFVNAGDLLYQIDPAPYQAVLHQAKAAVATSEADLATAEADLATAEANLPALQSRAERLKGLADIHAAGQQDADDAAAALRQAQATIGSRRASIGARQTTIEANRAALESAGINLSYTPIKAPISGRIGRSNITVGALATAYQPTPLAVIQQIDPIYVDVVQANTDLLRLRSVLASGHLKQAGAPQRKVRLLLEDGTAYPLAGTLQFRDVTVDPTTGSVSLRLVFPNPKEILLPGVFVRAVVEDGVVENAILAPQQGVSRDLKGRPVALVVNQEGKVEQRALTLDRAIGERWLVTGGLGAGERVIVEGNDRVRPGMTVRTQPVAPKPAVQGDSHV